MAVPKKRHSKTRKRTRRAQHDKISATTLTFCDNCNEPRQPHRVCTACGYYRGKQYIEIREV